MLEILFLVFFVRKLSAVAAERGRSKAWGGLGALLWVGGEFLGFALIGAQSIEAYGAAIGLAILGAIIAWFIVSNLENRAGPELDMSIFD